jgi:PAS domain S-box-containing protein
MDNIKTLSEESSRLRRDAEEKLQKLKEKSKGDISANDIKYLIHEFEVHQIELERQNEELRKSQIELEDSCRKYTDLYDFAPVGYFTFDRNGLILEVNLTGASLLGLEKNALMKKPFSGFIPREDQDKFYLHCRKVFETKSHQTSEFRLDTGRNSQIYARLVSIPVQDHEGAYNQIRTAVSNITEQMELQKENIHLASFPELNPNPVIELNSSGEISYANPSATKLFPDLMVKGTKHPLFADFSILLEMFKTGENVSHIRDIKVGNEWYEQGISYIRESRLIQFYMQNITMRRQAEKKIRLHDEMLSNLLSIQKLYQITEKEMFDFVLKSLQSTTSSEFAFIGIISEDETEMIIHSWSKETMRECSVTEQPIHYPIDKAGLWGETLRQRRPIIVNDYETDAVVKKGYPKGHVPIKRFLGVPVFSADGMIVAVAAVANKVSVYDESDINSATTLLHEMWNLIKRRQGEEALLQRTHDLGERVKELNCLYSISTLAGKQDITLEEILQEIIGLIPSALQYPEVTASRIVLKDKEFRTTNYRETEWKLSADINIHGNRAGVIEIYYIEEKPERDAGPFLKEEKNLINGIANLLANIIEHSNAETELRNALEASRDQQKEITALFNASRAVMEQHEFTDTARLIFSSCKDLIGATAGYVALLSTERNKNEVLFLDAGGLPCTVDPSLPMPVRGLRETAYIKGRTVYENDFPNSEWVGFMPEGHAYLENVLFAPLLIKGETVGIIGLANKPGGFTEDDVRKATSFSELTAVALHNSRLFEQLKNSEEKFRSVAQNATNAIINADSSGRITFCNSSTEKLFGYREKAMLGRPISLIMPNHFWDAHLIKLNRSVSPGSNNINGKLIETIGVRKDGSIFPIELSLTNWSTSTEMFFTSIISDITERKKAEQALLKINIKLGKLVDERTNELRALNETLETELKERSKAEERYRRITEAITDYIYTVNVEAGLPVRTKHGEACFAVTGYTDDEFINDHYLWIRMVVEEDKNIVMQQINQIISGFFPAPIEHRIVRKDGSIRWVENSIVPQYDANGKLISYDGIIRDTTKNKQLEAQLLHSQKMESVGTLAGGVAHDFNNMLTAIIGFANIVSKMMKEDDPLKLYVDHIQTAAQDAAALTANLLTFGRKLEINMTPLNINDIIVRQEKFLKRVIEEDIEFRTILTDGLPNVMLDSGKIEQVFINLAVNARDAMPNGGELTITTERYIINNEFMKNYGFCKPGEYALISISDTGTGMGAKIKDKIFEPFFTTKEVSKGTGLGLSMVYGIVKQHDGYIFVDSEPGKGTTFRIYLPLTKQAEETKINKPSDPVPIEGNETILVAEDGNLTRELLKTVLAKSGYNVISAKDGEEAVNEFIINKDTVQLVLLDVVMPRKNGKEAYDEIRKIRPDIKVLFFSGYSEDVISQKDIIGRGFKIIAKPLKPDTLLNEIREELDRV